MPSPPPVHAPPPSRRGTRPVPTAVLEARRRDLAVRDLSDPAAGPHAIQAVLDEAVGALRAAWGCSVRTVRSHPVVDVVDNYDRLHYPPGAVTRDARNTRYLTEHLVLRSHTSAMVPDALARLARGPVDDELLVCAGMVYRRDSIDRLHTGTPHQVDLWRIASRSLSENDLEWMVSTVVDGVLPGTRRRTLTRDHPYTDHGRQIDVAGDLGWIEIGECGLVPRDLLVEAGLDPTRHQGLAMGLGLDRLAMLRKGLPDIRLLRARDPRIAEQMLDLEPYRPVSSQPPVSRDVSIAVPTGTTVEELGDRVRGALGRDAASVESIEVVTETPYTDLPDAARRRLGMGPDQDNLLVRVVLRDLDRTLTAGEANELRDRIHAALHQGGDRIRQ